MDSHWPFICSAGTSATAGKPAIAWHWASVREGMAATAWTPVSSGTPTTAEKLRQLGRQQRRDASNGRGASNGRNSGATKGTVPTHRGVLDRQW